MRPDQSYRQRAIRRIARRLILVAVALAITAPAAARSQGQRFELGLDVGLAYLGGELEDGTDGIGQLRAGLFLSERFELEGLWSRTETDVQADLDRLLLNAVFNFGLRDRRQSYVLAGVGRADLDFDDSLPGDREERSSTVQVAAGRRFFLGPGLRLAARLELALWREQVLDAGSSVNASLTGGLTWRSGIVGAPQPGLIGGRAWIDEDGDGRDDEGREPPLPGVRVSVARDGEPAAPEAVTDEQGRYAFAPLAPGVYRLEFSAPDEFRVAPGGSPREVEVTAGSRVEAGLGVRRREAVGLSAEWRDGGVGGRVWADRDRDGAYGAGEGLAGIGLQLTGATEPAGRAAVSGAGGEYFFERCLPGIYEVALADSPELGDYLVPPGTSPQRIEIPAPAGLSATAIRDTVTGRVWLDADADGEHDDGEQGIAGAGLRLSPSNRQAGDETAAGADGQFRFEVPVAGAYRLTLLDTPALRGAPIPPGTSPRDLVLPARIGLVVDVERDTILGRVGVDRDGDGRLRPGEPGLGGVTLRLSRPTRLPSEVVSRPDGTFEWLERRPGTYRVEALEESLPPGHWIPAAAASRTVEVGPPVGLLADGLEGRIEGRLWVDENRDRQPDPAEPGVAGAEVTVSREAAEIARPGTDAGGEFGLGDLPAGAYEVAVVEGSLPPGMWPEPTTSPRSVEVLPALRGSITGSVWVDADADGRLAGAADRPLASQEIALRRDGAPVATVATGASGGYGFTDLEPGPYEVRLRFRPTAGVEALASPLVRAVEVAPGTPSDASFALVTVEPPPAPWPWWLLLTVLALVTLVWLIHRWWKYGNMLAPCFRRWRIFRGGQRAELRREIDAARRRNLDALEQVSKKLGRVCCADWDIATEFFLAHRGQLGWRQMHAIAAAMSPHLASRTLVRQQQAFALNRDGQSEQAEEMLRKLRGRRGPSAETCGLLGRVYKDRWDAARRSGDAAAAARQLDLAMQAYREGHESEPSNPYPGINLLTLMEFTETPAGERDRLRSEVRKAARSNSRSDAADYWAWATLVELAVQEGDESEAQQAVARAVGATDEPWQYETTLRNLRLIGAARRARQEAAPAWVGEVEAALERAFKAGTA